MCLAMNSVLRVLTEMYPRTLHRLQHWIFQNGIFTRHNLKITDLKDMISEFLNKVKFLFPLFVTRKIIRFWVFHYPLSPVSVDNLITGNDFLLLFSAQPIPDPLCQQNFATQEASVGHDPPPLCMDFFMCSQNNLYTPPSIRTHTVIIIITNLYVYHYHKTFHL